MKKVLCLCLSLLMILSTGFVQIASAEDNELIFSITEETGEWGNSKATPGHAGESHRWSSEKGATFKIALPVPAGKYEVFFWKCVHTKSTDSLPLELTRNGKTEIVANLDLTTGDTGWISLGVFEFDGTSEAYISATLKKPNFRISGAKLVPTDKTETVIAPENVVTKSEAPTSAQIEADRYHVPAAKVTVDESKVDPSIYNTVPSDTYKLVFADEFDEKIDENVWRYRTGTRLGGMNRVENVRVTDGRVVNDIYFDTIDGKEMITGGGIISRALFGYGYYETKCKLFGETGGVHSSFWSMGVRGDGENYPIENVVFELDGYEIDSDLPNDITCNAVQKIGEHKSFAFQPIRDYPTYTEFTFGYEWLPYEVNWYLNGEKIQSKTRDDIIFHYSQQNVWITGLANVELSNTIEIDKSKFPAEVSWDYFRFYTEPLKNINLVSANEFEFNINPDFGVEIDAQNPISWMEIGDADSSFIENNPSNATGGNNVLAHRATDGDYKVTTAQRIYYIANGNYNFDVYAMSSGGQKTAKIRLSDFNGDTVLEKDIPASDKMTKISFENIDVTDNEVYIEFISDATKDQWVLFDDPNFYCTHGREVTPALRYTMDMSDVSFGEDVVFNTEKVENKNGVTLEGPWKKSSQPGYDGNKTLYANEFGKDYASARYELTAKADGEYDVCYYNVGHPKAGTEVHIFYEHNGEKVENFIDLTQPRGWIKIGRVNAKAGDKVAVQIDTENGGLVRASAAALMDDSAIIIKDVLMLGINNNKAFKNGLKVSVDEANPDVVPQILNGRTMVPIRFIAEALGAEVGYNNETREITIKQGENLVSLTVDSDKMYVNGTEITLDVPAYVENGRTLVPVRAVSEGLNKKVSYEPQNRFVIIGEKTYEPTAEFAKNVADVFIGSFSK